MFKSVLSELSSSVVGAARATLQAYKPTHENLNGSFERIVQQGISNLAYRSPIMADMAHTMLQNFQLQTARKEQFKDYIKSKSANGMRKDVAASMGDGATAKRIDDEMIRILAKISNTIDSQGKDEAKKSDIFKQFGQHFTKFQKSTQPKSPVGTDPASTSPGSDGDNSVILTKIENNTQRTFNVLEEIVARGGFGGGGSNGKGPNNTFIDPMTGMPSVSAAVGSIGGSFLAKIFDDETIEKFSNKAKSIFGVGKSSEDSTVSPKAAAATPTPESATAAPVPAKASTRPRKRGGSVAGISDAMSGLTNNLNTDNTSESAKEKFTKISTENISESAKETEAATNKRAEDLLSVNSGMLEELKKANKLSEKKTDDAEAAKTSVDAAPKKGDLFEKAKSIIKDKALSRFPGLKTIKGRAGALVGKGAAKAINVGTKLVSSVAPKVAAAGGALASGLGSTAARVGGGLLARGALAAGGALLSGGALAAAAPWVAGAAAVGAVGYGAYKLYDHLTNKDVDPQAKGASIGAAKSNVQNIPNAGSTAIASNIRAAKSNPITQINSLAKEKTESEKSPKAQAPVVINTGGNGGGNSQSSSSQTIVTSSPVRNNESTFERVQMQDFWPRMA